MDIDLHDYTAGGFFITKYADRPAYKDTDLVYHLLITFASGGAPV